MDPGCFQGVGPLATLWSLRENTFAILPDPLLRTPPTPTRRSESDMDLLLVVPKNERKKGSTRSTEKVMDQSRRARKVPGATGVGADDTENISPEFAQGIKEKAMLLPLLPGCRRWQR